MRRWLLGWSPAIAWAALVFVLSSIPGTRLPDMPGPHADKVVHFVVYVVLGLLVLRGVRATWALPAGRAIVVATVLTALYGISDELHQVFTPHRTPDWHDAAADAAGGLVGALMAAAAASRSRPRRSPLPHGGNPPAAL